MTTEAYGPDGRLPGGTPTPTERHLCTADDPWTPEKSRRADHPAAKFLYTDDHWMDTADRYECPHCGKQFWVEVAN